MEQVHINITVPLELKKFLQQEAKRQGRSMANLAKNLLQLSIDRIKENAKCQ